MATIKVKRGTRSEINTAASASGLNQGELYLITDEDVLAVGTSTSTYEDVNSTSFLPVVDAAGNNVLTESGGVVTLTADEANVGSNALVVDSSGNVGVGATSLTNKLTINSSAFGSLVDLQKSGVTYGSLIIAGGYPGISVGTTAGVAINPNSVAVVPATSSGESDNTHDLGRSGVRWDDVYATNATIQTSDATEKENITTSDLSLDFIRQLNPVSYRFIGKTRTHYGLIAQEIDALLSAIGKESTDFAGFIKSPVTDDDGNETGEYRYGLRYTEFISPIIKAIQEQQTTIESQQSQIDALAARIEALEAN